MIGHRMAQCAVLLGLLICASPIQAQSVQQSGTVTPGHIASWATNGVLVDGGIPGGPIFTGSTTVNDFACAGASGTIIDCGLSPVNTSSWTGLQNFNGGATAPTRPQADNSTNVATTAYVASVFGVNPGLISQYPGATPDIQINNAIAAGALYLQLVDSITVVNTSPIALPANFTLNCNGHIITQGANVSTVFTMADQSRVVNCQMNGTGQTFTGDMIQINAGNNQRLVNVDIVNTNGYNLNIAANVGLNFAWIGGSFNRTTATNDAILLPASELSTSGIRRFTNLVGNGSWMMNTRGANVTIIEGSAAACMDFGASSTYTLVHNTRLACTPTINGSFGQYKGVIFSGAVTIGSGAQYNTIEAQPTFTITDNSGNATNWIIPSAGSTYTQYTVADGNIGWMLDAGGNFRLAIGSILSSQIPYLRTQNGLPLNVGVNTTDFWQFTPNGGFTVGNVALADPGLGAGIFTASVQTPLAIGGTAAGSTLTLKSTTGSGSGDAVNIVGGNNGGTTLATFNGSAGTIGLGSAVAPANTTVAISGNATSVSGTIAGATTYLQVVGANAVAPLSLIDAFGSVPIMAMRRADGTAASKTAIASADLLFAFDGFGYNGSAYVLSSSVQFAALNNWDGTHNDSYMKFFVTGTGASPSLTEAGRFNSSGGLSIGTTTDPGVGAVLANTTIQATGGMKPAGGFSSSPRNISTCNEAGNADTAGFTNQTPVITEVYIAEVFVPANVTVTGVAIFNGTVASGNVKVGLANSAGVNVATSASTASSGTASYQLVPFTGTYAAVGPATYYVETFYDNTTVRPQALTVGSCGAAKQTGQTYATGFTTITPPTTFTTGVGPVANLY